MKKIRILLIEDNRLLREGIATALARKPEFKVVAVSSSALRSLRLVHKTKPDTILLDLGLRNQNGSRVVVSLREKFPGIKVIGMGLIPSQSDIAEFVEAGASGFILKDATLKDFFKTIRSVAHGGKVLPPQLTGSLFSHVAEYALTKGRGRVKRAVRMTRREREIIALIADGLSNKAIAQRLEIATFTVKSHVHNIMEKVALHSRLQIVKYTRDEMTD
jgi:DNA-binding NarL/FixJ family response regulator